MTNQVLTAIAERRSIRKYKPDQITQEQLDAILKAALEAPTAQNSQPWHFAVVQDQAVIKEVNAAACANLAKRGGFYANVKDLFYSAPTVIFISSNKEATPWAALDCGIAAQTIALAAHSMGLGTVILGLPAAAWDGVNDAKFNELLKFPEGYTYAISLAVGFPDGTKEAHPIGQDKVTIIG